MDRDYEEFARNTVAIIAGGKITGEDYELILKPISISNQEEF